MITLPPSPPSAISTSALAGTAEMILVVDERGTILDVSPAAAQLLAVPPGELIGGDLTRIAHPADGAALVGLCVGAVQGRSARPDHHLRVAGRRRGWRWVDVEATALPSDDPAAGPRAIVVLRDANVGGLDFAAVHDAATGLPNRRHLERYLAEQVAADAEAAMHTELSMVKVVSVDELRGRLGLRRTDAVLRSLGRAIRSTVLPGSFVAVTGPGEYVIVNPPWTSDAELTRLADHLLAMVELPVDADALAPGPALRIAVGQASLLPDREPADTLDRLLRAGLAATRDRSRRPVRFGDLVSEVGDGRRRFAELRRAVAAGEIALHYQPIREIASGRIGGFEGLLRWEHPSDGVLAASEFLPAAEGTSLMVEIGDLVLATGCDQLAEWQRRLGPQAPSLALNVSSRELLDGDLPDRVERQIARSGVDPTGLCLELTEVHALDGDGRARAALDRVRALGVGLALDDFGGGYASLHRLSDLAADVVKIDRSVVMRVGIDADASAIVRAAIDLATAFGMVTVAEGVSTIEQHRLLASMGCDRVQGFLIAPAVPPEVAESLLRTGAHDALGTDAEGEEAVIRACARLALIDASYVPSAEEIAALAGVAADRATSAATVAGDRPPPRPA